MRICRCGVHAPPRASSCEECGAPLPARARDVSQAEFAFAALKLEVACAGCDHFVPVPAFLPGAPFACPRCGAGNVLDEERARRVLQFAHAVADLVGDGPEGRQRGPVAIDAINPFFAPTRQQSGILVNAAEDVTWASWLPKSVRAWASSGHPPGPESGLPLEVRAEGAGVLCIDTAVDRGRFAADPTGAHGFDGRSGFVGVIADEHRVDREPPVVERRRGANCPSCGATVRLDGDLSRVRCGQCDAVSYVAAGLRHRQQTDPRPDLWWLVFEGRSPYRRFLERDPKSRGQTDDREIEEAPVVHTAADRVARAGWAFVAPTLLLLLGGVIARSTGLADVAIRWLQGP